MFNNCDISRPTSPYFSRQVNVIRFLHIRESGNISRFQNCWCRLDADRMLNRPTANIPSTIKLDDTITWEEDNSFKREATL